jgi:hypothetical protein
MKMKYISPAVATFFIIISMLTFNACSIAEIKIPDSVQQSSDNKELVKNTEAVAVDSMSGNSEGEKTTNAEETNVMESAEAEILGDNYWEASDIMFYSDLAEFAFVYPQDSVTLCSNPYLRNDKPPFLLCVDIFPEGEDALPMDYNFAYEPSHRTCNISGTEVTEYIVFSRYDICDVTFERTAVFNNKYNQVVLTLISDREAAIESSKQYFTMDEQNCSGTNRVWNYEKQNEFYANLLAGNLSGTVQKWHDIFNEVTRLLQINEFKGASAGYNRLLDNRIFDSDEKTGYIISVSYPEFVSAVSSSLDNTLNKYIYEDTILDIIDSFKDEISQYDEDEVNGDASLGWQYTLAIDYTVPVFNNNLVSVLLNIYPYMGGAHGLNYFATFNYDIANDKLLSLADIFKPGFAYLSFLSSYCFEDIKNQVKSTGTEPDTDWIKAGTDASFEDNFANFLLTPDGIVIKFPAYQVGPGAAGDFSVLIKYDENMNISAKNK